MSELYVGMRNIRIRVVDSAAVACEEWQVLVNQEDGAIRNDSAEARIYHRILLRVSLLWVVEKRHS